MQKQTLVLLIVIIMSFTVLSTGAYFLIESQKTSTMTTARSAVDVPLESAKPATENKQSNSTLQVQGANTTNQQNQILTPEKFSEYEKFSASETILYQDEVVGTGKVTTNGDSVDVVYKGWLTEGTLFDQSRTNEQNQLVTFNFKVGAGQVILGWEQGIEGMKEGGKRRLIIPSQLGYGPNGQGPIPANSMLIFDVELIQVQKP